MRSVPQPTAGAHLENAMGIRDRLRARVKRLVKGDEAPDSRATRDRASITPVDAPSATPVDASAGQRIQPEPLSAPPTTQTGVPASPEPQFLGLSLNEGKRTSFFEVKQQ